jgi:23S rRNA (cytidine1920-2'-O)/16S rRNA (cytidine1409-2'-O)-methyltransferase
MSQAAQKKRLDILLVERGLAESRNKAQALILAGQVAVKLTSHISYPTSALKAGTLLDEETEIQILSSPKYVSRGGEKLESALQHWNLSVKNKICWDIGASTGGFTDCLLQHGAAKIYAIDVGIGQLHPKLRHDPRVEVYEKTHILKWQPPWHSLLRYHTIDGQVSHPMGRERSQSEGHALAIPNFFTVDVSFISLKLVLPKVFELLQTSSGIQGLILIKPQFEVGAKHLRKGIVKDAKARSQAIQEIVDFVSKYHFKTIDHYPCEIVGTKGNQEEWLYLNTNHVFKYGIVQDVVQSSSK